MLRSHSEVRAGPLAPLSAFQSPSAAARAAAEGLENELKKLKTLKDFMSVNVSKKGTTYRLPKFLAHHQVRVTAPHLNFKDMMDTVPAEPGRTDTADPFINPLAGLSFRNFAVLKIGDIPYGCTKSEIAHFLGREAQADLIDGEKYGPAIHIIMERSTAKTMDCYVEMTSQEAVVEHYERIWDVMYQTRPNPRIGIRNVKVELSSQDELMRNLFPKAKCVRWTDGTPTIMENRDPYSTGFTGYYTSEEMVGMVRHAETPARSPFCQKCPQRTYECMMDTVWKFPWVASTTYTLGDRNCLFVCYMKLLDVLVWKVDHANIVSLNDQFLLEYIFAGLNCRGFSERQRGIIHIRGGRVAAPIQVLQLHSYWPFEVVGKRSDLWDEEYCKTYLNLIEEGVQVVGKDELKPLYFFNTEGRLPTGERPPINITFFEFWRKWEGLSFAQATEIELLLMTKLLKAGFKKVNGVYPGTYEEAQQQERLDEEHTKMVARVGKLKMQAAELKKKDESPPQSPKGSLDPQDVDLVNTDNSPRPASESSHHTGTLGAGLSVSPLRVASASRTTTTPTRDPKQKHSTPTRSGRRLSFTVGDTIHEESEGSN